MGKVSYLDQLNRARREDISARRKRCHDVYKNRPEDRWLEVCNAHNRRVIRKARRSVGKSNKLGCRRTPKGVAAFLNHLQMWSTICRANRRR